MLDIPPNSMAMTEGFTVLKENALIENFQPHFHLRGKSMQVEAILPRRQQAGDQLRRQLQLQLDDQLHLRRRRGAAAAEGHGHSRHSVVRQHQGEQEQPGSRSVGRLRRPHGRRDGARLDDVVYFTDAEYTSLQAERKAKTAKPTNDEKQQ
jgi:hypothetical protein